MSQADPITPVQECLHRFAAGDAAAYDDLIRLSRDRLLLMTRAMLTRFPRVRRWEGSDDVLNTALLRLEDALRAVRPASTRQFLGLAATKIRHQLIDFVRHYYGPEGVGANHATPPGSARGPVERAGDDRDDPARLAEYAELQDLVEKLPEKYREVVDLHCYHGLRLREVAETLGVSHSTVKQRYTLAKVRLARVLGRGAEL